MLSRWFFCIILICCSFLSFSQKKQFVLDWSDSKLIASAEANSSKSIHSFQTSNFLYNAVDQSVLFASNVEFPSSSVSIESIKYENIPLSKLSHYNLDLISNKVKVNVKPTYARGIENAFFSFNPIVKINGVYKKVVSINLNFVNTNRVNNKSSVSSISDSNMSDGKWYKFYITKTGVYSLNKSFLSSLGVDVNNVNPKNIRVFGNGGKSIPLLNSDVAHYDVTENAIKFIGENDNKINDNDFILFYGVGSLGWDAQNDSFINPYIDKTCYYINVSSQQGKRIQSLSEPLGDPSIVFSSYNEKQFYEVDKNNLVQLGRSWFGDPFDVNSSQRFSFDFPNIDVSQPVRLTVKAAATSSTSTRMQVLLNDVLADNLFFSPADSNVLARGDFYSGLQSIGTNVLNVDLNFLNNGNPSANAYLDYICVESTSFLRALGEQFSFVNNDASTLSGIGQYVISNSESVFEVWDVTDPFNVVSKLNTNNNVFSFKTVLGEEKKYVAVVDTDFFSPSKTSGSSLVANRNIKGTIFNSENGGIEDVDYLVITPSELKSQADRLAIINNQQNGLRTRVVTLEDIYSEFNTGNQDIGAIRNFVKYVYDNAPSEKLKYLCLFGDASFDMKDRIPGNTNLVPSFNALQSFSTISGFVSDDFFGMMDESEGLMFSSDRLDIAVGRIVADDLQQATEMVTKIDQFYKQESYGDWRNRVTIVSDDVDVSNDALLEYQLDFIANQIVEERPFVNMVKIHSDSFIQESSSGGDLYPKAKEAILNNIQLGSSVVNYFGHGGEDGLASERLFLKNDAKNIVNSCRYNVFVTITCDFTRFDNPLRQTGGEFMYWNTRGGAVSLVATTRKIFFSTAIAINIELSKYLFGYDGADYVSVAEALRLAKNNIVNNNKRVVFNVGDPALMLPFPKSNIRLTHVNDISVNSSNVPPIEALGRVKLSGAIVDDNGQLLSNYNGDLSATIFDKKQNRSTLGNDGTRNNNGELIILDFETLGEIIFRGNASVVNGQFDFEFVAPRDLSIPLGEGRVSFYSKRNNTLEDKTGVDTNIVIGGINENAPEDNKPPVIEAFMNDESFVSGGITNQSPFLLLNLSDENGISSASGIGHDITAILDGDEANPVVLNDYYETELDDFTKGKVKYQYRNLEPGLHTLVVKAWDVYNNSVSAELQFMVVNENEELVITRLLNYPNPFVSYTEFWFNHNSSSDLDVMVQVYTVTGKLVKTLRDSSSSNNKSDTSSLFRGMPWDGKDDFGDKIGKGVYVYKLTVRSLATNKKVVKFEKLVIL